MDLREQARESLSALTNKQREVLDLVLEHKSSKEIARSLDISPYTVDQRISAARHKLGATSRGEVARNYSHLRELCGESAYSSPHMAETAQFQHEPERDHRPEPTFMLSDALFVETPSPWQTNFGEGGGLEAFDSRFGVFGRVYAIFGLAAALALVVLAMVAIAETLTRIV